MTRQTGTVATDQERLMARAELAGLALAFRRADPEMVEAWLVELATAASWRAGFDARDWTEALDFPAGVFTPESLRRAAGTFSSPPDQAAMIGFLAGERERLLQRRAELQRIVATVRPQRQRPSPEQVARVTQAIADAGLSRQIAGRPR